MELIYLWVENFRHIKNKSFSFSSKFDISFDTSRDFHSVKTLGRLIIKEREDYVDIYPKNISVTGIIGKNGTGKTSILDLLQDCTLDDSMFLIFYSEDKNEIILQGAQTIDPLLNNPHHIKDFEFEVEISLASFTTMELTSISYKNMLDQAKEVIINNEDYLQNKYNLSSANMLSNIKTSGKSNFNKIYNHYYSNDILRAIALFNNKRSVDVNLPFDMPKYINIVCKTRLSSTNSELFTQIFQQSQLKYNSVLDIDVFFHDLKVSTTKQDYDYAVKILNYQSKEKDSKFDFTLDDTQRVLDKLGQVTEYIYIKYSNPLKLLYQSIEYMGEFQDLILLHIINNYLSNIRQKTYRVDIFTTLDNYLNSAKNNFDLTLNYKDKKLSKRNVDAVISNSQGIMRELYQLLERTASTNDLDYFIHANSFMSIMDNIIQKSVEEEASFLKIQFKFFTEMFVNSYLNISTNGGEFLSFNWHPNLSSGQLSHITFYSRIYELLNNENSFNKVNNNILLLIDEGDLTLHPEWQKTYVSWIIEFLSNNFEKYHFHVILTSHSSFISSDLFQKDQIFLTFDEELSSHTEITNTFGANIHTLLSSKFFINDSLMGSYAHEIISHLISCLDKNYTGEYRFNQEEIKIIIGKIGEDFLRHKLFDMYADKYKIDIEEEQLKNEYTRIEKRLKDISDAKNNSK